MNGRWGRADSGSEVDAALLCPTFGKPEHPHERNDENRCVNPERPGLTLGKKGREKNRSGQEECSPNVDFLVHASNLAQIAPRRRFFDALFRACYHGFLPERVGWTP